MAQHVVEVSRPLPGVRKQVAVPEFERLVWPYRVILPFLFLIAIYVYAKKLVCRAFLGRDPRTNFWCVDGISESSRRVKEGSARWPALDVVYNFETGLGNSPSVRAVDAFWLRIRNAQAVRNRLVIVKRELRTAITSARENTGGHRAIRLLSLAAGAAQGVIEVVAEMHARGIVVEVTLVDQDATALEHARKLAAQYKVSHLLVATVEADVLRYDKYISKDLHPDIIEMCGLMDYLRNRTASLLLRKVHGTLRPGGHFLTCHVHPNAESFFLRHVVNWGMLYRTLGELEDLLAEGFFVSPHFTTEPLRIHSVAVCQK